MLPTSFTNNDKKSLGDSSVQTKDNNMTLLKNILSEDEYSDIEVLKYEYNYSIRANRYLTIVSPSLHVVYKVDLGNGSYEDLNDLPFYVDDTVWIESDERNLFGKSPSLGKVIRMTDTQTKTEYIDALLKEWTKAKKKNRTLDAVESKRPKTTSKYKRITKSVLEECKQLRDSGQSWDTITSTLREYNPKDLKERGIKFIAKENS